MDKIEKPNFSFMEITKLFAVNALTPTNCQRF